MKHTKLLILSLVAAMTFSACGTDDSLQFNFPDKENNGGGNTGGGIIQAILQTRTTVIKIWQKLICHKC